MEERNMKEHSTSSLKTGSLKKSKLLRALISLIVCISIITLYIPVSLTVEAETEEEQVSFGNEQAKDDEDKTGKENTKPQNADKHNPDAENAGRENTKPQNADTENPGKENTKSENASTENASTENTAV